MQATCGGNGCGAGWFYCLMVSLGVGFVPQLITRGDIRKQHGMQVNLLHVTLSTQFCPDAVLHT